jgi:hypothetical protein
VSVKKLVFIIPCVGQVQSMVQNPEVLTNEAVGLLDQARVLLYVGEQIGVRVWGFVERRR